MCYPLWCINCFIILNVLPDYVLLRWPIVETTLYILKSTSGFGFHWWPQQWRGQNQSSPEPCRCWGEMVICSSKLWWDVIWHWSLLNVVVWLFLLTLCLCNLFFILCRPRLHLATLSLRSIMIKQTRLTRWALLANHSCQFLSCCWISFLKFTSGFGFHWWQQQWRGHYQSSPEPCRCWG